MSLSQTLLYEPQHTSKDDAIYQKAARNRGNLVGGVSSCFVFNSFNRLTSTVPSSLLDLQVGGDFLTHFLKGLKFTL